MPKLLIITGDLAAGKSTFSQSLSKRYNVPVFNKDNLKEMLGDTIGFANREENLKLSKATVAIMLHAFEVLSSVGKSLILEANFHEGEMEALQAIAEKNGCDMLTLNVQADTDILYERFMHRLKYENRHPVHKSGSLDDRKTFGEYLEKGRSVPTVGKAILVCADSFDYQTDPQVLKPIDAFMGYED